MKPVPNWRRTLRHAWSIRLNLVIALGAAFATAAAAGPDRWLFGVILFSQFAPIIARLIRQEKLQ